MQLITPVTVRDVQKVITDFGLRYGKPEYYIGQRAVNKAINSFPGPGMCFVTSDELTGFTVKSPLRTHSGFYCVIPKQRNIFVYHVKSKYGIWMPFSELPVLLTELITEGREDAHG